MKQNESLIKIGETASWEYAFEHENWVRPLVNIEEVNDEYVLTADMPGVTREYVRLRVVEGVLEMAGRVPDIGTVARNYVLMEVTPGNYFRKFKLSDNIDQDGIAAKYENGRLTVFLPKTERAKTRDIAIK